MKYTRGSKEGNRRCVKCDNECSGTYFCHAGLMDFSVDIVVNGEKMGAIIGGQVLPKQPEKYIQALRKVPVSTEKRIRSSANLLGIIVNQLVNLEYFKHVNAGRLDKVKDEISKSGELIAEINDNTGHLKGIANRQTILSLNATIEAARSGEAGKGFAVVAKSMQELSGQSASIYNDIEKSVGEITRLMSDISTAFEESK